MRSTAQSNESPTVNDRALSARGTAVGSGAGPAATAEETIRLAFVLSVDEKTARANGQNAPTETPLPVVGDVGSRVDVAPVVSFPPELSPARPRAILHALQEWEGYVVEMDSRELVARLVDLTAGSTHEEEEAVIPMGEISECDVATVRVGSIFCWVIGYERSPSGTKKRVSQIVFRDLPRMTESDFREARSWARETLQAFQR